jgi:hypothetical protein
VQRDRWQKGPPLTSPMEFLGAAVVDDQIHAVSDRAHQVYDAGAGRWRDGPPSASHIMPSRCSQSRAACMQSAAAVHRSWSTRRSSKRFNCRQPSTLDTRAGSGREGRFGPPAGATYSA